MAGGCACMTEGMLAGGHACRGPCMLGRHVWQGGVRGMHVPPRHHEIWSVNAQPVRILLECILVVSFGLSNSASRQLFD